MLEYTILEHATTVILAALFAVGFRALVLATPARRLEFKPFSCDTCLVGWGSILGLTLADPVNWSWQGWEHSALILFQITAATGLARILAVRFDRRGLLPNLDMDTMRTQDFDKDPVIEIENSDDEPNEPADTRKA